jgi:hypothetical protein
MASFLQVFERNLIQKLWSGREGEREIEVAGRVWDKTEIKFKASFK